MMVYCAIDIQGYCGLHDDQYITPKEVSVNFDDGRQAYFYVKPIVVFPFLNEKQRRIVYWATVKYHGLGYSSGEQTQKEYEKGLREATIGCDFIVTKGLHKKKYLTKLLGIRVLDLGEIGCPTIRDCVRSDGCENHQKEDHRCSKPGAAFMLKYYNEHNGVIGNAGKVERDGREEVPGSGMPSGPDTPAN
jgi:hypothetical protein